MADKLEEVKTRAARAGTKEGGQKKASTILGGGNLIAVLLSYCR